MRRLVEQISREIRTMSHLLHPPLLDEVGLASALALVYRWILETQQDRGRT
jgi:signal transduction histidine kinase